MADDTAGQRGRMGEVAVLAVAVITAGAVTAYLFLGGDDASAPGDTGGFATNETPGADDGDLGMLTAARPEVGQPAPDFALVDARDGTVRKLSDFRGTPVLVNWYASWCGPCKREIPEFNAMLAAVGEGNIVVLGIDYQEDAGQAIDILDELGASYPALLDSRGSVADHYRVGNRLPSSFFVDADGVLRAMRLGELREEDLVEQLATIGVTYEPVP